jgi:hypothetical protein
VIERALSGLAGEEQAGSRGCARNGIVMIKLR